ncbi:unannotated protein [freshwater metagenome]|uniref:Unannotated protein n=1 Tax=freshwater metagenome TaxID=449393 RepID=A0A6J7IJ94_9ZZZZ
MRPTHVAELEAGEPAAVAQENARRKAQAARAALHPTHDASAVVLACDTVVALDGVVYGKPQDAADAQRILGALAGRTHEVLGALAIAAPDGVLRERTQRTRVTFAALSAGQIEAYVETQEWAGRAGGYAIQGLGAVLVECIEGDYLNVVGLPVPALRGLVQGLVRGF